MIDVDIAATLHPEVSYQELAEHVGHVHHLATEHLKKPYPRTRVQGYNVPLTAILQLESS